MQSDGSLKAPSEPIHRELLNSTGRAADSFEILSSCFSSFSFFSGSIPRCLDQRMEKYFESMKTTPTRSFICLLVVAICCEVQ
jgi:hypothetical protein